MKHEMSNYFVNMGSIHIYNHLTNQLINQSTISELSEFPIRNPEPLNLLTLNVYNKKSRISKLIKSGCSWVTQWLPSGILLIVKSLTYSPRPSRLPVRSA